MTIVEEPKSRSRYELGKYGIDENRYLALYERQGGRCAICRRRLDKPCIDHDHETNDVRGLLCTNCNTGLGLFGDNTRNLASAIVYLQDHGKTF